MNLFCTLDDIRLSQNSCHLDRSRMNRGEKVEGKSGSIRTSLQKKRDDEAATVGKCQFAAGFAAVLILRLLHSSSSASAQKMEDESV